MDKKLLIADDSLFMRTLIKSLVLKDFSFTIIEASNGAEAVAKYKATNPDLVILDITMPEVNGIEALKQILDINKNAKVIMCSALGGQITIQEALSIGAKDFIVKPYFVNIKEIIENTIEYT
jgi:two-component system, chemotaxis family, chemotaxis protein CheY